MKKRLILPLCLFLVLCLLSVYAQTKSVWKNPFSDVSEEMWFYEAVSELGKSDIVEDAEKFFPEDYETRGSAINYLYRLFLATDGDFEYKGDLPFTDVTPTNKYYDAVCWAYESGLTRGVSPEVFDTESRISREECATFIVRYADMYNVKIGKVLEPDQFKDSLDIHSFARSSVVVCKMADMMTGYKNGYFYPYRPIKRSEFVSIIYKLKKAVDDPADEAISLKTSANAYDSLYDSYISYFKPRVAECAPVDVSYFDDCAIIGDSVTLSLKNYCAATGELGNATFLCAGSMSARNALYPLNSSYAIHPSYKGSKMLVEDAVAASGVNKVYIMLGMNGISFGVEEEVANVVELTRKILDKSPHVKIFIQSVTPMASSSNIKGSSLNNTKIAEYNSRLEQVCNENRWYYIHVADAVTGADGNLIREYCSDFGGMGIHFSKPGDVAWINYLRTHVPEEFR